MPQITITISNVYDFPYKFTTIKGTIIVIESSILSPNLSRVKYNSSSDNPQNKNLFPMITL